MTIMLIRANLASYSEKYDIGRLACIHIVVVKGHFLLLLKILISVLTCKVERFLEVYSQFENFNEKRILKGLLRYFKSNCLPFDDRE